MIKRFKKFYYQDYSMGRPWQESDTRNMPIQENFDWSAAMKSNWEGIKAFCNGKTRS